MASDPFLLMSLTVNYFNSLFKTALMSLVLVWLMSACAPVMTGAGNRDGIGRLTEEAYITADNATLPLSLWPVQEPKAIVVALHGFNDYRRFFGTTAEYLQKQGIFSYAYDQRGFGGSPNPGFWAGDYVYADDLMQFTALIKRRHPGVPIYLLGESMGGAIIVEAMTRPEKPEAAGIILAAPAVWGWQTMPWYQRSLLWSLSHTTPWLTLTGRGLDLMPSDNIEMLKALGRDPLVIKETRVDALYGLTELMENALTSAEKLHANTLLLYGERDEIIRPEPTKLFVQSLLENQGANKTIAYYQQGYHMLLRDLQASLIWKDIVHWMLSGGTPLPSGADRYSCKLVGKGQNCYGNTAASFGIEERCESKLDCEKTPASN